MIKEQVRIKDLGSLHLRPAKEISKVASQYKCSIKLMTDNVTANAKSIEDIKSFLSRQKEAFKVIRQMLAAEE